MRWHALVAVMAAVLLQWCGSLSAAPTTSDEALAAVMGWLRIDPEPLDAALGQQIVRTETFRDPSGDPIYYVVYLAPSGFVVVSADDLVEPIIAFADDGTYDPALDTPLGALVTGDLTPRVQAARTTREASTVHVQAASTSEQKWNDLILAAGKSAGDVEAMESLPICDGAPSDVRVAPFTVTRWSQRGVYSSSGLAKPCYNYYTPPGPSGDPDNYPSGCVATAMAGLMYYHAYPTGTYSWGQMVAAPNYNTGDTALQAIGRICRDAGTEVGMVYGADGSSANVLDAADALKRAFKYTNAVKGFNENSNIGEGLVGMINPNLDARYPVMLGVHGPEAGHAVLADGYGYDSARSLYHHLNMGFSGLDDCWYNLPAINCSKAKTSAGVPITFTAITKCVYNVFRPDNGVSRTGEIISGRVTDKMGKPLAGAVVTGDQQGWRSGQKIWSDTTDDKGIFALVGVAAQHSYRLAVQKTGYEFTARTETVGNSQDGKALAGNKWGVDFQGARPAGAQSMRILWDVRHGVLTGDSGDWSPYGGYSHLITELRARGFEVSTTADPGASFNNLSSWDVLVISVGTSWDSMYTLAEVATIRAFVEAGGGLLIMGDHPRCPNYVRPVAMDYGFITAMSESWEGDVTITSFASHPIFNNCSALYFCVAGRLAFSPGSNTIVAWDWERRNVVGVASAGLGRVLVTGDCDFCTNAFLSQEDNRTFILNVFDWLTQAL